MRLWLLPAIMAVLAMLSLLLLKSVAPSLAGNQFVYFCLGFVLFAGVSRLPFAFLEKINWVGYLGLIILLIIPLVIGKTTRGIAGWIDIGTLFSIQPSQLAIPLVALVVARQITLFDMRRPLQLAKVIALLAIPAGLILVEPDLGTTVIYILALGSVVFISPVRWRYLLCMAGLGILSVVLAWTFVFEPYQKNRITSFLGDSSEMTAANYNAQQSLIAVGSGQLMGRGLGHGVQSHLRFLPERQTDFIYASMAEELGFIGSSLVVLMYSALSLFCLYVAIRTENKAGMYFSIAAAAAIAFQSGVNMGMNMGILPITGITLPLLSYGGSSILATCLLLGIVQSLNINLPPKPSMHLT